MTTMTTTMQRRGQGNVNDNVTFGCGKGVVCGLMVELEAKIERVHVVIKILLLTHVGT